MQHHNIQKYLQTLIMLVFACMMQSAQAAIPPTLNYQGHLTDSGGAPVDGAVDMVFAIYDIESSGTPLWSESQTVTVNQGVFSIELGQAPNVFPLDLFETPLWFGLSVGLDTEMLPRRPITSTGFAFKAGDADTLEGISASTLNQSTHVSNFDNPHKITPNQIDAPRMADLVDHTGNFLNPHKVTAAQTGAVPGGDFSAHRSDESAHHSRYNNAEAVAAMGKKNDLNTLNHDRYSNSSAVAAIKAADGAGSTLDADMVDGLQASEIIDAAQDEVRTPISSVPYNINASGSYYLTGNLNGSTGGINITADDVTLDLMGFTINGGGTIADYGIDFTGHNNITIRNGTVKGFGKAGVFQGSTAEASYATVTDVQALGNGTLGSGGSYSGIYLHSSNSHIERCTVGDNGGFGIYVSTSSKLINNTAYSNNSSYGIYGGISSSLSGNTVHKHTGSYGIYGDAGSSLSGNTAYNNNVQFGGIYGGFGSIISGNTAYNNTAYYGGIRGDRGASLIGNTAYNNSHWGIYSSGSNLIKDNTIYFNNPSDISGIGGLSVNSGSRVVGNTLDSNNRYGIVISSSNNALENNLVTDSVNGFLFQADGNFYANNRVSNISAAASYAGAVPTGGGDGGGNASF